LDAVAKLYRLSRAVFEAGAANPSFAVISAEALKHGNWVGESAELGKFRSIIMSDYRSLLALVREGVADGSIKADVDQERAAFALFFALSGYLHLIAERWSKEEGFIRFDPKAIMYCGELMIAGLRA
jgi:hypothetical protein